MSGKNNIDQLVKNSFDAQEIPVNEAHWTSAQSFIQAQRRKRRRAAAYWVMGLLLLLGSLGYLTYSGLPSSTLSNSQQIATNGSNKAPESVDKITSSNTSQKNNSNTTADPNSTQLTTSSPIEMDHASSMQLEIAIADSSDLNLAAKAHNSETQITENKRAEFSASLSLSFSGTDSSSTQEENSPTEEGPQSTSRSSSLATSEVSSSLSFIDEPEMTQASSELSVLSDKPTVPITDSNEVQITLLLQDSTAQNLPETAGTQPDGNVEAVARSVRKEDSPQEWKRLDSMPLLDILPFPVSDTLPPLPRAIAQVDSVFEFPDSLIQDPSRNFRGFFLMPYLGPSISFKTLSGNDEELLDKRKKEESIPLMPDIGVMARYGFSNNLYIGSGLNYYQMGENAKYSAFETVNSRSEPYRFYKYIDTGYLEYTSWDTAFLSNMQQTVYTGYRWVDKDSVAQYAERTVYDTTRTEAREANNRLSYIEIPILIGYQVPLGKWSLGGDVGTGFNFLVNAQGLYPDIEQAKYSPLERSDYRLLNYTFVSNLSVGRQLGQHWTLYGNLRFRNQLGSAQKPNEAIAARYRSVGFQFRLNYVF